MNCNFDKIKSAISGFVALTDEKWNAFSSGLLLKTFKKGDFLIREGQTENYIYFLNAGATRNYFLKDGRDYTVDFQFEGDFVTAYLSFISREPSPIFIELLEEAEVVAIPYRHLQEFYKKDHEGERIGRLMAEFQYVKRLRKEMDLLAFTAEERYALLLSKNPELIQNISVKHLSSYLGIQPESLSRIRKLQVRN
ncbi:Crp/Fnr family transcriptional regulator [Pedobacter panaciterrae]|jgi:cAMP-binding proteins - catabolite gene activator and regulatory subunit of cAMP-dependent protein kinases|uniref:Crp/Fnr family transcriptional regulator n=1 Tax=Pedobacter panaciterrae TaxID=363849 RepID=A0ABU8NUF8_9SPHI|nr:Crp/Fnr family transcriptional regulator [Pedobacter panaciterrae]NQX54259.1 Crp/Fnr family transcriptional regulator [Pedobacter panaciterrae]